MAQNVIINGVTYQNCPEVDIPKQGGGTALAQDATSKLFGNIPQIRQNPPFGEGFFYCLFMAMTTPLFTVINKPISSGVTAI